MTLEHIASLVWSNDLRLNHEATTTIADLISVGESENPYVHMLPFSLLPAIDPEAFNPQHERSLEITSLPHWYLPDEILAKSPRETLSAYGMRINLTLAALDLIETDDEGMGFSQQFAVDSEEQAREIVAYGDANYISGAYGERYTQVLDRIGEVCDGVYPRLQLSLLSAYLRDICTLGCQALQCKHALEYGRINARQAGEMISLMKDYYGTLPDLADWSPHSVSQWVDNHMHDIEKMKQLLLEQDLLSQEIAERL